MNSLSIVWSLICLLIHFVVHRSSMTIGRDSIVHTCHRASTRCAFVGQDKWQQQRVVVVGPAISTLWVRDATESSIAIWEESQITGGGGGEDRGGGKSEE